MFLPRLSKIIFGSRISIANGISKALLIEPLAEDRLPACHPHKYELSCLCSTHRKTISMEKKLLAVVENPISTLYFMFLPRSTKFIFMFISIVDGFFTILVKTCDVVKSPVQGGHTTFS